MSHSLLAPLRRIAIVDDEPVARLGLRRLIERLPGTSLVGEARSGPEAVRLLRDTDVHILFLDVHMPGADAFELLTRIPPERVPVVVVVTAFPEYAVRAFDLDVADYLLKPFDAARFLRAWERACAALAHRTLAQRAVTARPGAGPSAVASGSPTANIDAPRHRPLLLRRDGQVHVVALREVDWIEAGHNVVQVHTARGARAGAATRPRRLRARASVGAGECGGDRSRADHTHRRWPPRAHARRARSTQPPLSSGARCGAAPWARASGRLWRFDELGR
ncbi:MAG: response regulator [Gemmatimonadaceae bacterium]|nr:response regulator [Gemmatimonadaceae bacterium]